MVPTTATPVGIYDYNDNQFVTGLSGGVTAVTGMNFGTGLHPLSNVVGSLTGTSTQADIEAAAFDRSFERYIWDDTVSGRLTPVKPDTFILISAGPDRLYGTGDDVTNFNR